jgi:hypothetical protein
VVLGHVLVIPCAVLFMIKAGSPYDRPPKNPTTLTGFFSSAKGRNSCAMHAANLERARRIAFCLTQRHRRGTPEFRYRLGLECDIACEMLRAEESARPGDPACRSVTKGGPKPTRAGRHRRR